MGPASSGRRPAGYDATVIGWCLETRDRGLNQGDCNAARSTASVIARAFEMSASRSADKMRSEHLDSIFESWLAFEHPKAYRDVVSMRETESSDSRPEMSASDMNEMIDKLRSVAGF